MSIIESAYSMATLYIPRKPKLARSKSWQTIRKEHLAKQPTCQACGAKTKLQVHHIIPIHIDKDKELDPNNLLTLCENPKTGYCHYIFGHLALSWWKYDADVIQHVSHHRTAIEVANETQDDHGKPV